MSYAYVLRLTLDCQLGCAFDFVMHIYLIGLTNLMPTWLGFEIFFENFDLFELPFFSPKVFLKLLSGARPFFTLHSCFRQGDIYLMQCAMQCMIVHEWNGWAFKFIFHLNSFYSLFFLGFTACFAHVFLTDLLSCLAMLFLLERHYLS